MTKIVPIVASEAPTRAKPSNYPEPFLARVAGRTKRPLGDVFGLTSFGVNHTRLAPGTWSALRHAHTVQDELVYVLEGNPTLVTSDGDTLLEPGMCVGFKAGSGNAHHLVNHTDKDVVLLEMGDRNPGDAATYPDEDLLAVQDENGKWRFTKKDGSLY
ncbi:MAG: cupin domain-containing protein [Polyangiaceae bacterium]